MFVYTNNRKSAEDVPVRIAKGVVAIETRCTAVSHAVVQVAERKPETPHDSLHSPDFLFYIAI